MKMYFISEIPCALFINELYFGITDKFARHAEMELSDGVYVRFCPENYAPISFFLTENIRFSAPAGTRVYILKDSIAIYAESFPPYPTPFQVLSQIREKALLATLFVENGVQLSLQTGNECFTATLPPAFISARISIRGGLIFVEAEQKLAVYSQNAKCLFMEETLKWETEEDRMCVTLPLYDRLSRTAVCVYRISENALQRESITVEEKEETNERFLAYAFFENLLIGANYEQMLSSELLCKKEELRAFLGDFEGVILTEEENTCGLIKKKGERLFEAQYYKVKTIEGKIVEIEG